MLSLISFITKMLFIALLLFYSDVTCAEQNSLQVIWTHNFGDDEFKSVADAVILAPGGEGLWIAGKSTPVEDPQGVGKFWLWKINQNGEKIQEIQLKNPYEDHKVHWAYRHVNGAALLEDGALLLLIEFVKSQPSLVKVNSDGSIAFIKEIVKTKGEVVFHKIVPVPDGNFLLIGRQFFDALIMKVDATGNVLWERKFDHEKKQDLFLDGFSTADGGAVIVGNSGVTKQFYLESSHVWIVKFDADGGIQSERMFPGRHGSVVKDRDGGCVIAYDKSTTNTQEVWLQALDPDLKLLWETRVSSIDFALPPFQIAPMPGGGFILAASKLHKPWTVIFDNEGKQVSEGFLDERGPMRPAISGLIPSRDAFFLLSFVSSENAKRQSIAKVGLIKFTMR